MSSLILIFIKCSKSSFYKYSLGKTTLFWYSLEWVSYLEVCVNQYYSKNKYREKVFSSHPFDPIRHKQRRNKKRPQCILDPEPTSSDNLITP